MKLSYLKETQRGMKNSLTLPSPLRGEEKKDRRDLKGFSLVELLITIAISSILMTVALSTYMSFTSSSSKELALDSINADVKVAFKMLERDAMMAGYGLPTATRVASDDNCVAGVDNFCRANSDRLFIADGWEMLTDITDNGEDDGSINTIFMTFIANAKNPTNPAVPDGYRATPTLGVQAPTSIVTVNTLNINNGEEDLTVGGADNDIKVNNALIIANNAQAEGHRIGGIDADANTITLLANEFFATNYGTGDSIVPAIAWYIRQDPDGKTFSDSTPVFWLYRNNDRVMPYVNDFQIRYGYDANNDGIEWADTIPPTDGVNGYDDWAAVTPGPDGMLAFAFSQLKVIEITMDIRFVYKGTPQITAYQTIVNLRN